MVIKLAQSLRNCIVLTKLSSQYSDESTTILAKTVSVFSSLTQDIKTKISTTVVSIIKYIPHDWCLLIWHSNMVTPDIVVHSARNLGSFLLEVAKLKS